MNCPLEVTDTEICRKRGDNYPIEIIVTNKVTGNAEDITGNTFILSVSNENEPSTANYEFQSTGSIIVAEEGTVTFPISEADSDRVGCFYFDIQMTAGVINTTIMGGRFDFYQDITK